MKVIYAPQPIFPQGFSVFLAGSIEQDTAIHWQDEVITKLHDVDLTILNPRRKDWDSSWGNTLEDYRFVQQVQWEIDAMDAANLIIFYFDPNTKSPITLLELGLHATDMDKAIIVCCEDGFWRKGNVDMVCRHYSIEQVSDLASLIEHIGAKAK